MFSINLFTCNTQYSKCACAGKLQQVLASVLGWQDNPLSLHNEDVQYQSPIYLLKQRDSLKIHVIGTNIYIIRSQLPYIHPLRLI